MPRVSKQLLDAIAVLKQGGVVLFPTETSYGLAADATSQRAVRRVSEIKGREPGKTPSLICADRKTAEEYIVLDPLLVPLVDAHWPGALTVVGKVGKGLAAGAVKEDGTVAIRVSPHPIAKALAKGIAGPIVATSANVSGLSSCYSVSAFLKQLKAAGHPQPDFTIDDGPIPRRKPSTIVAVKKGKVVVLRAGSIDPATIAATT